MFKLFILTLSMPREKIGIIKALRYIAGPDVPMGNSLKFAKNAIETQVEFEDYMGHYVSLKLTVDEAALGRAWYWLHNVCQTDCGIVDVVGIDPINNDFDLTAK